jgi:hypothetical protein
MYTPGLRLVTAAIFSTSRVSQEMKLDISTQVIGGDWCSELVPGGPYRWRFREYDVQSRERIGR